MKVLTEAEIRCIIRKSFDSGFCEGIDFLISQEHNPLPLKEQFDKEQQITEESVDTLYKEIFVGLESDLSDS
jgi:hypothetical protein